jgi:chorismate-pyruvate lyase
MDPVHDTVRYDVEVDTDIDPHAAPPHAGYAMTGSAGIGQPATVSLPVGDCRTTVYAMTTGYGSWRLLIRRFPGRFGASATLMAVTEQLRHALRHARLTPTHIASSSEPAHEQPPPPATGAVSVAETSVGVEQHTVVPSGRRPAMAARRVPNRISFLLDRFVAQHDRPAVVGDVDFVALSPYHRTLLAHDGLTTAAIESWWLEPINVRLLSQQGASSNDPLQRWLGAPPGVSVQRRQVIIEGLRSQTPYLYADSLLATARLPGSWRELPFRAGIGAALAAGKVETRRELLWYGRRGEAVASRAYRIFVGGEPALLIQEDFLR